MAFDKDKREKMRNAINNEEVGERNISVPNQDEQEDEPRKPFTFTLQPSMRDKLNKVARENNYKSTSRFLNDLINEL